MANVENSKVMELRRKLGLNRDTNDLQDARLPFSMTPPKYDRSIDRSPIAHRRSDAISPLTVIRRPIRETQTTDDIQLYKDGHMLNPQESSSNRQSTNSLPPRREANRRDDVYFGAPRAGRPTYRNQAARADERLETPQLDQSMDMRSPLARLSNNRHTPAMGCVQNKHSLGSGWDNKISRLREETLGDRSGSLYGSPSVHYGNGDSFNDDLSRVRANDNLLVHRQIGDLQEDLDTRTKRWESLLEDMTQKINLLTEKISIGKLGGSKMQDDAEVMVSSVRAELENLKELNEQYNTNAEDRIRDEIHNMIEEHKSSVNDELANYKSSILELKKFFTEELPAIKKGMEEGRGRRKEIMKRFNDIIETQSSTWIDVLDCCQRSCEDTKNEVDAKIDKIVDFVVEKVNDMQDERNELSRKIESAMSRKRTDSLSESIRPPLVPHGMQKAKQREERTNLPSPPKFRISDVYHH